ALITILLSEILLEKFIAIVSLPTSDNNPFCNHFCFLFFQLSPLLSSIVKGGSINLSLSNISFIISFPNKSFSIAFFFLFFCLVFQLGFIVNKSALHITRVWRHAVRHTSHRKQAKHKHTQNHRQLLMALKYF